MQKRISIFALFLAIFLCAFPSFAQNATTSLRGVVKDASGAVIPGATVTLSNPTTGFKQSVTSASNGEYQLQQIPPAKYNITIRATGFGVQTQIVELLVNQPATINATLSVTADNVVVEVNAAAQTLNTTDASLGGSNDNATIQALPSEERNIGDLLSLQPGVFFIPIRQQDISTQDSRSGAVNGGRSDQGNVTLDGVDDNDQVNGYAFFGVLRETQDSTEEFRVTTGQGNADTGRSSGAQLTLVTKSGNNKFHGAAYEYFRPTNTVSNDFFNKQGQLASGFANRPPKLIRHVFGGDIGGPIFKDKLFFFANYEGKRQAESTVVNQITPTADYKAGIIDYQTAAGGVASLSAAQVTQLDAANGCAVCNTAAYTPGPGPNPNALAYFSTIPTANGTNLGDFGLTTGSYTFASPAPVRLNTTIVRLDYVPSSHHRIFVRGNLQDDVQAGTEEFPGQPASYQLQADNKGLAAGETWTITSHIVNDIRYGFTRQGSAQAGVGSGDYVDFRAPNSNFPITPPTAETRSTILSSPVNNLIDNLNISKGNHDIQLGVNWRLIYQNRSSNDISFNNASTNPSFLGGDPPDPQTINLPAVQGGVDENQDYQYAFGNLIGAVPQVTNVYNYQLTSATAGSLLADGAFIDRHFKANEYEGYIQDAWRIKPNLTITYGVRYTVLQTPWETHGQEVTPTIDTDAWFKQRESSALQGQIYEPDLTFAPAGRFYGKPGFYPKNKDNVAPRLAIVYAPDSKTSIRAGAGIYYDHFGEGLINTFDQNGEFGLSTSVTSQAGVLTYATAPRFTGRQTLPFSNGTAPSDVTYPYTFPQGDFGIQWGLDNKLKTPYSETFDLSVQRQLPGGFTLETAYVGRLGRHLLQSQDLAEPVDYVDPQGGGDYYSAGAALSKLVDANGRNSAATVSPIPYFEHVFPYMAGFDFPGESATQAIYSDEWSVFRAGLGATTALADIDFYCFSEGVNAPIPCPSNHVPRFWQDQFASLYAQNTIGMSYYNSAQITLRHPMSHGLQTDISYTFSRSIDYGSDTERATEENALIGSFSDILNTWKPYLNKGISDFDTTHLLTIDWVYQLPIGKGQSFLGTANPIVNALIGGWQSSGIFRLTSGLPFSFSEPGWTTDWQIESDAVVTDKSQVTPHRNISSSGNVSFFTQAQANNIANGLFTGSPIRLPYPGEAGERNFFRGDGYLNLDSSLSKAWNLEKYGALKFAWEVYNVTNTVRFDPAFIASNLGGPVGAASSALGDPSYRRMQFSLRYDF